MLHLEDSEGTQESKGVIHEKEINGRKYCENNISYMCDRSNIRGNFNYFIYVPERNAGICKGRGYRSLFGTEWAPTAADPKYGILYIILTSIIGTAVSILIGVPIALLTAVFLTEVSNKKLSAIVQPAVELLAPIPSVIYGLLGLMILNPIMYKLEKYFLRDRRLISLQVVRIFWSQLLFLR